VLRQANYDLTKHQFNTVASAAMKILNAIEKLPGRTPAAEEGVSILLRLLSPITPHVCHYLWRALGFGEDVMTATWPEPDPAALAQDEIEYVVQVNGKKRGTLLAPNDLDQKGVEVFARASDPVKKYVGDSAIKKIIVVPGRLINIVI
jgi:leucyl-tRNA synthetase